MRWRRVSVVAVICDKWRICCGWWSMEVTGGISNSVNPDPVLAIFFPLPPSANEREVVV